MNVTTRAAGPPYLDDFLVPRPAAPPTTPPAGFNRRVGTRSDDEHYARSRTHEGFGGEITDAHLTQAVVVGRYPRTAPAQTTASTASRSDARRWALAPSDPSLLGEAATLAEVDRAVQGLGLAG